MLPIYYIYIQKILFREVKLFEFYAFNTKLSRLSLSFSFPYICRYIVKYIDKIKQLLYMTKGLQVFLLCISKRYSAELYKIVYTVAWYNIFCNITLTFGVYILILTSKNIQRDYIESHTTLFTLLTRSCLRNASYISFEVNGTEFVKSLATIDSRAFPFGCSL